MTRTSRVRVNFDNGTIAETIVRTIGKDLTREEANRQHDEAVDNVVNAIRSLPYAGQAPLRAVEIV